MVDLVFFEITVQIQSQKTIMKFSTLLFISDLSWSQKKSKLKIFFNNIPLDDYQ